MPTKLIIDVYLMAGQGQQTRRGQGLNNPLRATAQGFFVRVSPGQTSDSLTFRNTQRRTHYTTAQ